jgi:hypothetical protein
MRPGLRIDDAAEKAEHATVHAIHGIKVRDFAYEGATPRLPDHIFDCP